MGLDIVIQAHVHNYQRTYPISYNNNDPSNPTITSTNPNDYKDPKGPIFVIVGTAGKSHAMFEGTKNPRISQVNRIPTTDFFLCKLVTMAPP